MTWQQIAAENAVVELPSETRLRFGVSATDRFVEKTCIGIVTANAVFFGSDPAKGVQKALFSETAATAPAPADVRIHSDPLFLDRLDAIRTAMALPDTLPRVAEPSDRERTWALVLSMMAPGLDPAAVVGAALAAVAEFKGRA